MGRTEKAAEYMDITGYLFPGKPDMRPSGQYQVPRMGCKNILQVTDRLLFSREVPDFL